MYALNGRFYAANEPQFQDELALAYARRERPRCACLDPAAPMYIASSAKSFVVKRMPCTGDLHAVQCPHHSHGSGESIGDSTRPAIQRDPVTGQVQIRVAFAMSSRDKHSWSLDACHNDQREVPHRLTLRDLVLFLWSEAELTTWRPEFAGKRNWAVVRHHLLRAASSVSVNGVPLARALFVPEVFSVANSDDIRARRLNRFAQCWGNRSGHPQRMLLIGEVKELATTASRPHVVIRHLPDTTIRLPPLWAGQYAAEERPGNEAATRLIIAATFDINAANELATRDAHVVAMSAEWLPMPFAGASQDARW